MQSTLKPEEADPHDVFEIAPGVVLSARADQASPTLAPDAISHVSAPQAAIVPDAIVPEVAASDAATPVPAVDTTFRAASVDDILVQSDRTSRERWIGRALMSLFAMFAAVAAAAWQHYGDTAKHTIASWVPPFAVASSPPAQKPALAAQPATSAVQAVQTSAPTQAPAAPAAPPVVPASAAAAAPAAVPTDTAQLQSMTRDLAAMGQQMEQLKASIAQLRAGQEQMAQQMSRDFARTSEARSSETRSSETRAAEHARIAPLPRSAAAPLRKPRPALSPTSAAMVSPLPPAAAAPLPPPPAPSPQATIQPDGESVVRPPLPVR
jgi:hypothetical protein